MFGWSLAIICICTSIRMKSLLQSWLPATIMDIIFLSLFFFSFLFFSIFHSFDLHSNQSPCVSGILGVPWFQNHGIRFSGLYWSLLLDWWIFNPCNFSFLLLFNVSADHLAMDDSDGDEDTRAYFPCPFCYVDIEVHVLCSHLQNEHCFDLKNAVCASFYMTIWCV